MPSEPDRRPGASNEKLSPAKKLPTVVELRRQEMERRNARRTHKPNLKTIPWKK